MQNIARSASSALNTSGIHELIEASLNSHQADQRSNFSRKSTRASEWSGLCQRAEAGVCPARILRKGLFRFQEWDQQPFS